MVGAFEISNQSELKMVAVESSVKQIKTRTNIGVQGGAKKHLSNVIHENRLFEQIILLFLTEFLERKS